MCSAKGGCNTPPTQRQKYLLGVIYKATGERFSGSSSKQAYQFIHLNMDAIKRFKDYENMYRDDDYEKSDLYYSIEIVEGW